MNEKMSVLLEVTNLSVKYPSRFGDVVAIEGINLSLKPGEIHGLVGESGAGKSTIGAAIIGLVPSPGYISSGTVKLYGQDLSSLSDAQYHKLRGAKISMIFQDPQTSLNPLLTIKDQMVETILQHAKISYSEALTQAYELLEDTGISDAKARLDDYPHQFSGGQRQRIVIALALCTSPDLIIADEPTTALDVAIQKQILALIRELADKHAVGFILITHDIGVIAEIADFVSVFRMGKLMETGKTKHVLGNPQHEYTQSLMAAVPRLGTKQRRFTNISSEIVQEGRAWKVDGASADFARQWLLQGNKAEPNSEIPVLRIEDLDVTYYSDRPFAFAKREAFRALHNISLEVPQGKVLGIIGESGSGKSTLAKSIVGLLAPNQGRIAFQGEDLPLGAARSRHHPARRKIQMIFQDPFSSLNSRRRVLDIIAEPLRFFGLSKDSQDQKKIVASILELVEMPQRAMLQYPHQFSGGQRQRIAIARALVAQPEFLICDEPTSALDVSIQAQILNLLKDLQETLGLTILFISHNLAVVRQMADSVVVLKNGELVENAPADFFFSNPQATYSKQLLRETPSLDMLD